VWLGVAETEASSHGAAVMHFIFRLCLCCEAETGITCVPVLAVSNQLNCVSDRVITTVTVAQQLAAPFLFSGFFLAQYSFN